MSIDNRPALKSQFEKKFSSPLDAHVSFDHFSINEQDRLIEAWEEDATESEIEDMYEMALAEPVNSVYLAMMSGLLKRHTTPEHIAATGQLRESYTEVVGGEVMRILELWVNSHPLTIADDLRGAA